MAILSDISDGLIKMDASRFQQLGDELLASIYKPTNIESRGTKEGQAKTIKGSPDTIFTMSSIGKILIEYTTQSNRPQNKFIQKLKSDIASCINTKKTRIPLNEIREIVLFSNQRIATNIQDDLRTDLSAQYPHIKLSIYSLDDITVKLRDFPKLLQDYLGISTYPGLVEIDSFIQRFSSKRFSYLTPIDNPYFEIATQPISKGFEILKTNDIVIISGDAGMGKTRYAVEIAKAYSSKTHTKVFVIEEKNHNIREILDNLNKNTSYLFIIDDANRTAIWDEVIEFYKQSLNSNVKFIATVRSYALDSVVTKCFNVTYLEQIEMSKSPEDLASKILTSFGITNHLWHRRINDITGRNIRLAVMCAQIAMAGEKYNDLLNVEGIYDAYYKQMLNSLISDHANLELIKVISIISFYKVVDLGDNSLLQQIEDTFDINKSEFISLCHKLDASECISITDYKIATIPDQNFGTYIFYQCFYVHKALSLSNLVEKLYNRRERLRDSMFSVWNCFHKTEVIVFSKNAISDAWKALLVSIKDEREKCEFLESFGGVIPEITFPYIKHIIQEAILHGSLHSRISPDNIISILSHFSHSDESDIAIALALMVELIKVYTQEIEKIAQLVSEHWLYDEVDYANSYKRLTTIINTLIDLSEESEQGFQFAYRILPSSLNFIYPYSQSRGRKLVFGRRAVIVTDELKDNRTKVWKWINKHISKINQSSLINNLYNDFFEEKSIAKKLVENEIDNLNECIGFLNIKGDFNVCKSLAALNKRIKTIMGKEYLKIDWSQANPLYALDCQIKGDCKQRVLMKYEVEHKNISKIIETKSLSQLKCFVNDISQIAIIKNTGNDFRISYVIESTLELSLEKGIEIWQYCIDREFHFIPSRIISAYYNKGYDLVKLFNFAKNQECSLKSDLLLTFVSIIDNPSSFISEKDFCDAIRHYNLVCYRIDCLCERYYSAEQLDKGYRSVLAALLWRVRNSMPTSGSEEFLLNFCKKNQSKVHLVGIAYINGIKHQYNFDHKHDLLKYILQSHAPFWVECCKNIPSFVKQYHISPYDFIWDIDNYSNIIESALLYYSTMSWIPYDEKDNLFSFFYNLKDDRATYFIDAMIRKYCQDSVVSNILFEIVATNMGVSKVQHYITFISHNPNIDNFKQLDLFPHLMVGGDSFAHAVKSRLDFVTSLIEGIRTLKQRINFLDHIQYLTERKESLEREYAIELRIGHKHRLYDL